MIKTMESYIPKYILKKFESDIYHDENLIANKEYVEPVLDDICCIICR